jgi:hypothetical protein
MYREESALRAQADRIDLMVALLPELVPDWSFSAPASNRLRAHLVDVHSHSRTAAQRVRSAADALHGQADAMKRDQDQWDADKRAEDRRLEDERRQAAQKSSKR